MAIALPIAVGDLTNDLLCVLIVVLAEIVAAASQGPSSERTAKWARTAHSASEGPVATWRFVCGTPLGYSGSRPQTRGGLSRRSLVRYPGLRCLTATQYGNCREA